jgi:phage-related protein
MTRKLVPGEKPLFWIGSSLKDITRFPSEVQRSVGFALSAAQYGGKHPFAKPWKGEGPGVLEVVKKTMTEHIQGALHRSFHECCLCSARVSEEVTAWDCAPTVRRRFGQRAFEVGAEGL